MPTVAVISASLALLLVLPFLASAFVCTHRSVRSLTKCFLLLMLEAKLNWFMKNLFTKIDQVSSSFCVPTWGEVRERGGYMAADPGREGVGIWMQRVEGGRIARV